MKEVARKITSDRKIDADDLLHDTIVSLYDSDKNKINKLIEKKELLFWIVRIMINQYHSSSSPYYKKYKKYYNNLDEKFTLNCWNIEFINNTPDRIHRVIDTNDIELKIKFEKDLKRIQKKLKELHWFDSNIFRIYHQMVKGFSLNKMAKETGINRNTLYTSIKKAKEFIKNE